VFHPTYAPDFLQSCGGPVLTKFVDLTNLQAAPTSQWSDELREVISDASLTTRLSDANSMTEVLLFLEHKSRPSRTVALQLLVEAILSLHQQWVSGKRPESGQLKLPIPLMVVVYNGCEDWDGEIWFHDLFPDLPVELREFVPQFRVIFINLRRFQYGRLPGRPETRACVESLMRATDGTFIDHLPDVLRHVAEADLSKAQRLDLTKTIASYFTLTTKATSEQLAMSISSVFRNQEFLEMYEGVNDKYILEGIEIGRAQGEAKGEIKAILALLRTRYNPIPDDIIIELSRRTDPTALESLVILAAQCKSLDEFARALK